MPAFSFFIGGTIFMSTIRPRGKTLALIAMLLLCGITPAVQATAPTASTPQRQTTSFTASNYWALCVGIGIYAENPEQDRPLMLSEVDAFASTLLASGYPSDHVKVIKGENATLKNIFDGFRWLRTHENSSDVSVVFLSTHGSPLNSPKGTGLDLPPKDENDSVDEMLVTYWGFAIPTDVLIDDDVNVEMNRLPSQNECLIVDSCYAGGFNDHWKILNAKTQNRVILMGSKEDEEAMSGGFAPWLIDALRGYGDTNHDGIVTAEEAFNYTRPRAYGQTPTIYDGFPGEFPLVAVLPRQTTIQTSAPQTITPAIHPLGYSATVHGYIKDSDTTQPLQGATVEIYSRYGDYDFFDNTTTTNATGYYEMTAPAGRYRLTASADQYCSRDSGAFMLNDGQTKWMNLSLYPRPAENATITGYLLDNTTSEPLNGTQISVTWRGHLGQSYTNKTYSNPEGFYTLSIASGTVSLTIQKNGYFGYSTMSINIEDNEMLWLNATLVPHPKETALIQGYLTDADTGAAVPNVQLTYQWMDITASRSYMNTTTSSSTGFYSISVSPGELYRDLRIPGYDYYDPFRHDGTANTTTWQNISLAEPRPTFEFYQPLNALYVHQQRVIPLTTPIIIGSLNVSIYFEDMFYGRVDVQKVEFYVDGTLKSTVTQEPYSWLWSTPSIGKHTLTIVAYNNEGLTVTHEKTVRKLL